MKSENNGKIAIAIVAMFVVALSIVGITYAYFTVSVVGNKTEKSVEVQAGILEIVYTHGNEMVAQNIVPGWESDGLHYFDATESYFTPADTDVNGNGEYDADVEGETALLDETGKEVKAVKAVKAADANEVTTKGLTSANGITNPVTFSVSNTKRNSGDNKYAIKLVGISNGIATNNADDAENLTYELYSVDTENATTGGTLLSSGQLGTIEQVIVTKEETIAQNDGSKYYYLMLKYANNGEQNASMNTTVKATVKVVGITNIGTVENPKWIDDEGQTVTFAS